MPEFQGPAQSVAAELAAVEAMLMERSATHGPATLISGPDLQRVADVIGNALRLFDTHPLVESPAPTTVAQRADDLLVGVQLIRGAVHQEQTLGRGGPNGGS